MEVVAGVAGLAPSQGRRGRASVAGICCGGGQGHGHDSLCGWPQCPIHMVKSGVGDPHRPPSSTEGLSAGREAEPLGAPCLSQQPWERW